MDRSSAAAGHWPVTTASAADAQAKDHAAGARQLTWVMAAARPGAARPHHYLLLLRFALVNLVGLGLLGLAQMHGLIGMTLAADQTHLVGVIVLVFLVGLTICAHRIWQTSRELNRVRPFDPLAASMAADYLAKIHGRSADSRALLASSLRLKLTQRTVIVRHIANSLVLLGLIGTVVGFIIALSGVDPDKARDFDAVSPMVSTLIAGMSTALFTTLVGAILNVWLTINHHVLTGGTVKLMTALVELGEENAGP